MTIDCQHPSTKRGKNIPLRYGSWRSEVCRGCGAYRARDHHGNLITGLHGGWKPASGYKADTTRDPDE